WPGYRSAAWLRVPRRCPGDASRTALFLLPDAKRLQRGRQERRLPESDQLQRDVVRTSTLVRQRYQLRAGQPRWPAHSQLADLLRLHLACETVGAEHQRVPTTERQRSLDLDTEVLAEAEGPHHNMGARVMLGRRRAEHAGPDELGDQRVILGQLADPAAADEEGPTVAHVRQERVVVPDDQRSERRPHRFIARGETALAVNGL